VRLAHLADLHLGWRQFERTDPSGCNLREADVERALEAAVGQVVAARPDAVLVAGDVFHSVRPTNRAILAAFRQVARLRAVVPDVIVIPGNHDTPRSAETGRILPLLEQAGARVALEPTRFDLPGAVVTCVPSSAADAGEIPEPYPGRPNVLLLHGDCVGYPTASGRLSGTGRIDPAGLVGWDYVALGDYHSVTEVRPRMWYSGSIEYTSSNVWADLAAGPKCWLLVELNTGTVERQEIPTRRHVDIPPVDGTGLGAGDVDVRIAERIAEFPVDDAVARLIVINVPREVQRALNHARIRRWKAAAINFHLVMRRPETETRGTPASRARMFESLDRVVDEFLRVRELPADLEPLRPNLRELASKYLTETKETDA